MKQALKMPEQLLQLRPVSVRQTHPSCKIQRPQTFHRVFCVFCVLCCNCSQQPSPKGYIYTSKFTSSRAWSQGLSCWL